MKNILILSSDYSDSSNANGICVRRVAEYYQSNNRHVIVVSTSNMAKADEIINDVRIKYFPIDSSGLKLQKRLSMRGSVWGEFRYQLFRIARYAKLLFFYPNCHPSRTRKLIPFIERLITDEHIDLLLCTCRPYDSIDCGIKIKEKYRSSITVKSYYLDNIVEDYGRSFLERTIKKHKVKKHFKKEVKTLDSVFLPVNSTYQLSTNNGNIKYLGFPLYQIPSADFVFDFNFDDNYYNAVYIGTIDSCNRDPLYAISLFNEINKATSKPFRLHIWGRIADNIAKQLICSSRCVEYHGYIDNKYTSDILRKSDVVLNLSNRINTNYLPSKIFQLFALNLKVINIFYDDNDCSMQYWTKYPNSLNIKFGENICAAANRTLGFMTTIINKEDKTFEELLEFFKPSYICEELENK